MTAEPDAVVIIDSPEFTHPIAKRIRRRTPPIPIIDYVSPSVWAWRPGRARRMRPYVDHVLALWPFEPEAHRRLGGPPCSFVGHPLIERHPAIVALDAAPLARASWFGGRRACAGHTAGQPHNRGFAAHAAVRRNAVPPAAGRAQVRGRPARRQLGATADRGALAAWPLQPHLVEGEDDKFRAFKLARAALAASGTVTLELALAGTPMVVAYKVGAVAAPFLRRLIKAPSAVLPNLVLGRNVVPEFHQQDCTPARLAKAVGDLLDDGPVRARQLEALARIPAALQVEDSSPSEAAARIVIDYAENGRGWPRVAPRASD